MINICRLELVDDYESKVGKLSELPYASYHLVNGSIDQMEMSRMMLKG